MPNQHSTLTDLFSDIASAIRAKGGTSASIAADAFPTAISNLPSGGGTDYTESLIARTILSYENTTFTGTIGSCAFFLCTKLSSVKFDGATSISSSAFGRCSCLYQISFPSCKYIGPYAFNSVATSTTVPTETVKFTFPLVTNVSTMTFGSCSRLYSVDLPKLTMTAQSAFAWCSTLSTVSLGSTATTKVTLASYTFRGCTKLLSLYLMGPYVASLVNVNAFTSTPISTNTTSTGGVYGKIYVPASLYSTYSTSTNWVNYSARMVSI